MSKEKPKVKRNERLYWRKRNRRTDKIAGAVDELIGISDVMRWGSPQKKSPIKKKKSKSFTTIVIDKKKGKTIIRVHETRKKQKKPKVKKNLMRTWI